MRVASVLFRALHAPSAGTVYWSSAHQDWAGGTLQEFSVCLRGDKGYGELGCHSTLGTGVALGCHNLVRDTYLSNTTIL
ncbi:hypothetical protein KIPB_002313 [Kipferlia bialata]|uniref:Uncharacterized protein n=1 Tax=Kipferlia bialata TaxID=797122 RepID=A0A9K3CSA1_9EUKA|nr:hypothetical protein KIPB_002313 [Kipferlia bialata]|eukprot:g2313.t1